MLLTNDLFYVLRLFPSTTDSPRGDGPAVEYEVRSGMCGRQRDVGEGEMAPCLDWTRLLPDCPRPLTHSSVCTSLLLWFLCRRRQDVTDIQRRYSHVGGKAVSIKDFDLLKVSEGNI